MNYEKMSREELISLLVSGLAARSSEAALADDAKRLLHDLQVHQIELEMQSRELMEARSDLEESRNRYADLYDFAPVPFIALDEQGIVHDLNLRAAKLLGLDRDRALGQPLTCFLKFSQPALFWQHLGRSAATAKNDVVDLHFSVNERSYDAEFISVATAAIAGAPRQRMFRTALLDSTRRRRAEAELARVCSAEQSLRAQIEAVDHAFMEVSTALAVGDPAGLPKVIEVILKQAMDLTNARRAELQLVDDADFGPDAPRRYSAGSVSSLPVMNFSSELAFGGRSLGVLSVYRSWSAQATRDEGARTLQMYGERVSSALERARLQTLERRETNQLALLATITNDMRNHRAAGKTIGDDLAGVSSLIVPKVFGACTFHVLRGDKFQFVTARHEDAVREEQISRALHAGELGEVFRRLAGLGETQAVLRLDQESHPGLPLSSEERVQLAGLFALPLLVFAPLRSRGRLLGIACFAATDAKAASSADEPRLPLSVHLADAVAKAEGIASRCAGSLEVAFLLEELKEAVMWRENVMASISHDLRSPLNTIALGANALADEGEPQPRREQNARLIQRALEHMNNMLGDLVTMSGLEAGVFKLELANLPAQELVKEACEASESVLHARSLCFECSVPEQLPRVVVDRERILRVFSNLIANAAKFTPAGGHVKISAREAGNRVQFAVADTGPGIPSDKRKAIFERFWQGERREKGGLGLGLYIARGIVEAHGGQIWVESEKGQGAKLCFDLPRAS
ncbi:MAG: ATP-binding protein [Myxococcales bacterium]